MAIRKRASGVSLNTLKEDGMLRSILQAGLQRTDRDIQEASDFGDVSEKVELLYQRKKYIEEHLAADAKLSLVRS